MRVERIEGREVDAVIAEEVASVSNAVDAADAPHLEPVSARHVELGLRYFWDNRGIPAVFLARQGADELAAYATVELPREDNLHLAFAEVYVHPENRTTDAADELLAALYAMMRETGRTLLIANSWRDSWLEKFWVAHGLEIASNAAQRRLIPTDLDWQRLDDVLADSTAASQPYEIVEIRQPVPDDLMDGMLELKRAMNDAPLDDLAMEDDVWTEERYRNHERALANREMRNTCLAARHRETGEMAGFTAVVIEEERPHLGFQEDTGVVRAHRGHRLGLRLKIEMLRLLREREPQIRQIDTWNAVSNAHMIAVNEALGCFVVAYGSECQRDLATA